MTSLWLSVLLPTYNGAAYINSALSSILLQNDDDIECIAVDNGSTDQTLSVLRSFQDRLHLRIEQQKKGNWVSNTNYALSLARGKFICFLHQDDIWFVNRLNTVRHLVKQFPDAGLLLHSSTFIDKHGNPIGKWTCPLPASPNQITPEFIRKRLLIQNFISVPGAVIKRELAEKVNGMDEDLWYTADWDFWLKISAQTNTIYHPIPLSGFRIHPTSQTLQGSASKSDFQNQLEIVLKRHIGSLKVTPKEAAEIHQVAKFSIKVNTFLANALHGNRVDWVDLLVSFTRLGPSGWHRYFRDSRVWQRALARINAGTLKGIHEK